MIRVDVKTKKEYTHDNIPIGRLNSIQNSKSFFKIFSQSKGHSDTQWYHGEFLGDSYAVFEWVNTSTTTGFYQQVSKWYMRYGDALNKMLKLAK